MAEPAVRETLYLLYLDRHHLGDDIFMNDLAQRLHQAPPGEPLCLLVHGSGEKVERTLEHQGFFPERTGGVLDVEAPEQVRLVERGMREANRKLVATLTDEVVPAVGIQGVDRNLLQWNAGVVTAPRVGWVEALVKQRVVPVISALVEHPEDGRVREVSAADAAVALAKAFEVVAPVVVFFTTSSRPGLAGTTEMKEAIPLDALPEKGPLPEPDAVRHVVRAGVPGLLTSLGGLFAENGPSGTWIRP